MALISFSLVAAFSLSFYIWFSQFRGKEEPSYTYIVHLVIGVSAIPLLSIEFSSGGIGLDYTLIGSILGAMISIYALYNRLRKGYINPRASLLITGVNAGTLILLIIAVF